MKGKVIILGAGISQVPLIRKARQMGYDVIVLSWSGPYPGIALADRFYNVSITDVNSVLQIAEREQISGICTTGTDAAVLAIGAVNDRLSLQGISTKAAQLATNKWLMKQAFSHHGVRTAECYKVSNRNEAHAAVKQLMGSKVNLAVDAADGSGTVGAVDSTGAAVIFKAVDRSASRGVVKVTSREQVDRAFAAVMSATDQDYCIVEQYLEGVEFGAQAFVYDGEVQFILAHGDLMHYGETGVPIGHHVPYAMSQQQHDDMIEQLTAGIRALHLNNCAVNADFMSVNERVYTLEIGARAGATCLPELVTAHYGLDYYEQILRVATGEAPQLATISNSPTEQRAACVCELLICEKGGIIKAMHNYNGPHPDIVSIAFDHPIGAQVAPFRTGNDRIGHIVVKGQSLAAANRLMQQVKANISVVIN